MAYRMTMDGTPKFEWSDWLQPWVLARDPDEAGACAEALDSDVFVSVTMSLSSPPNPNVSVEISPKPRVAAQLSPDTNKVLPGEDDGNNAVPAVEPSGQSSGTELHAAGGSTAALTCDQPDCNGLTFGKPYELKRHIRTKHGNGSTFVCGARGCFHGEHPLSFHRSDKLTAHIKASHSLKTYYRCSVEHCPSAPVPLELLWLHLHKTHVNGFSVYFSEHERAVVHAASPCNVRCPSWRCRKHVRLEKFQEHVLGHSADEMEEMRPELGPLGCIFNLDDKNSVSVAIICPQCHHPSASHKHFRVHFVTAHLLKLPLEVVTSGYNSGKEYPALGYRWMGESIEPDLFPNATTKHWDRASYIGSLLPASEQYIPELLPTCLQVLRLWPEYINHPVFHDIELVRRHSKYAHNADDGN